jgi:hypothetical protein
VCNNTSNSSLLVSLCIGFEMVALSHYFLVLLIGLSSLNEVNGSFWDHIVGISHLKSWIQGLTGDEDGAQQTKNNYATTNMLRAIDHHINGKHEDAKNIWKNVGQLAEGVVDSLPVVGHAKGGIHYAIGQRERGDAIMKSASRSVGVIAGGTGGFFVGGPVGAVAGGVAGGAAVDGIITGKRFN